MTPLDLELRGVDAWGDGSYGAPRAGRPHNGVDYCAEEGQEIHSLCDGLITKIGYPYPPDSTKGYFRYVEVRDKFNLKARYFYVQPSVKLGEEVKRGQLLGVAQNIAHHYAGMKNHIHLEVMFSRSYLDPTQYLAHIKEEMKHAEDVQMDA